MSIPVRVGASRVFPDRIDLFARSADGVPVTLRLGAAEAQALACLLDVQSRGFEANGTASIPAILEHPYLAHPEPPRPLPFTPG